MIDALIALGIIPLFRAGTLISRVGICTVLRKSDDPIGIFGMILVKELVVLLEFPQVPAKIEVVAVDVGNLQNGGSLSPT